MVENVAGTLMSGKSRFESRDFDTGPFIKYVRRNIDIFDPPSLCVRQRTIENAPENNRYTQEINRKFTLPPSVHAYVLNEWSLRIMSKTMYKIVSKICLLPRSYLKKWFGDFLRHGQS